MFSGVRAGCASALPRSLLAEGGHHHRGCWLRGRPCSASSFASAAGAHPPLPSAVFHRSVPSQQHVELCVPERFRTPSLSSSASYRVPKCVSGAALLVLAGGALLGGPFVVPACAALPVVLWSAVRVAGFALAQERFIYMPQTGAFHGDPGDVGLHFEEHFLAGRANRGRRGSHSRRNARAKCARGGARSGTGAKFVGIEGTQDTRDTLPGTQGTQGTPANTQDAPADTQDMHPNTRVTPADKKKGMHVWAIPARADAEARFTLIMFHGNTGNFSHRLERVQRLWEAFDGACNLVLPSYPGYGLSEGHPQQRSIEEYARRALSFARARFPKREVVLYGHSLGAAVSLHLAAARPSHVAAVAVDAPFTSTVDAGRYLYPSRWASEQWFPALNRNQWRNELAVDSLPSTLPLLVAVGDRDEIVPPWMGAQLFERSRTAQKRMLVYEGAGRLCVGVGVGGCMDVYPRFVCARSVDRETERSKIDRQI
jgi:pimeloyl-ACP methyl ester carboxylesterase